MADKLKVNFAEPKNGWLPVEIEYGDQIVVLDISDITTEPIDKLIDALMYVANGWSKTIIWHLEPVECELDFKVKNYNVTFNVTLIRKSKNSAKRSLELSTEIAVKELSLEFLRAIQKLESYKVSNDIWPNFPISELDILTSKVKEIKNQPDILLRREKMKVEEYEKEVISIFCSDVIPQSTLRDAINKPEKIECKFTGAGYYLDLCHHDLPKDRIVCNEPHVIGNFQEIEVGFVVSIENNTLCLECYSYGNEGVPSEIRNGTVQVSTT